MKKTQICFLLLLIGSLTACHVEQKNHINGVISGATEETLYLEAAAIDGIHLIDSCTIQGTGDFKFAVKQTEAPSFYRLRMNNKIINLAIDSTETVTVQASYPTFSTTYTVTSANNQKIKELTLLQIDLQKKLNKLEKEATEMHLGAYMLNENATKLIEEYKKNVRMNYIYKAPNETYAYFALFQSINGMRLFNPMDNREDARCFAAVATSFCAKHPASKRAIGLKNITLKGIRTNHVQKDEYVDLPKMQEVGIIDISLADRNGTQHKLSDLKGKVVLLDFIDYSKEAATDHNFFLRDLYKKYAAKGLEIYQVSIDNNIHFWKTISAQLPWICVNEPEGVYSSILKTYNIQSIPSLHIINRANEYVVRVSDLKSVDKTLKKLL